MTKLDVDYIVRLAFLVLVFVLFMCTVKSCSDQQKYEACIEQHTPQECK